MKTLVSLIEREFYFLGYDVSHSPLRLARRTLENHEKRFKQLYEQRDAAPKGAIRLDEDLTRWQLGADGLGELLSTVSCSAVPALVG